MVVGKEVRNGVVVWSVTARWSCGSRAWLRLRLRGARGAESSSLSAPRLRRRSAASRLASISAKYHELPCSRWRKSQRWPFNASSNSMVRGPVDGGHRARRRLDGLARRESSERRAGGRQRSAAHRLNLRALSGQSRGPALKLLLGLWGGRRCGVSPVTAKAVRQHWQRKSGIDGAGEQKELGSASRLGLRWDEKLYHFPRVSRGHGKDTTCRHHAMMIQVHPVSQSAA